MPPLWLYLGSMVSGILLCVSELCPSSYWVQCFALIPLLAGFTQKKFAWQHALLAGLLMGGVYAYPRLLPLKFPSELSLGLTLYLALWWMLFAFGANYILRWPPIWSAFGLGALAVITNALNIYVFPMWGTAQSWVRVWADAPGAIQFISLTGISGIVFLLVTSQQLIVQFSMNPESRHLTGKVWMGMFAFVLFLDALYWIPSMNGQTTLRIATIGWHPEALSDFRNESIFLDVYVPAVSEAKAQQAELLVSPECGFAISKVNRQRWLKRVADLALENKIHLAFGYFNEEGNDNRVAWFDSQGNLRGEYTKTHLVRFFEDYVSGTGTRMITPLTISSKNRDGEINVGAMICQDDNFTDLSRAYGREKVALMAVPTNDWEAVKREHFQNSRLRAIEGRYSIARASMNGISAIISSDGRVIAQADHYDDKFKSKLLVGSITVPTSPDSIHGTLYSWAGEWLLGACFIFLAFAVYHLKT